MQRIRGAGSTNENVHKIGLGGSKKLNSTTTAIVGRNDVSTANVRPRAALGDIGNRVNRTLQDIASKKSTVDVLETKKEDVLIALRKIEPRKPLRSTASFKSQVNVDREKTLPPVGGTILTRHTSIKYTAAVASTNLDVARPTETSRLKTKITRTASVSSAVVRNVPAVAAKVAALKKPLPPPLNDVKLKRNETEASRVQPSKSSLNLRRNFFPNEEKILKDENVISADSTAVKDANAYSTAMIPNIDADDGDNPMLVSDFVNDIYDYLRILEREQAVRENFLACQEEVKPHMRAILVDWLVQVHTRFHLLPETMYMTTMLIDRFLQAKSIKKEKLQLVGVSAMFVASKYEEMYAPEIGDFVFITDNSYTKDQVRGMERLILQTLDFRLGKPLPIHFLRRYSKAADANPATHALAKYFMELSLIEYSLCHVPPSILAAAALWLSLKLLGDGKWTPTLVYYSTYSEADVMPVVKLLCQSVHKAHSDQAKLKAVRGKYSATKFLEISRNACLTSPLIREIISKC